MNRRTFLAGAAVAAMSSRSTLGQAVRLRGAVIGHTGRGEYGHGMDLALANREDIELVAVSDPDEKGRERARVRIGAARAYGDYREMLEKEKPQIVAIGPRITGEHHAMALAALTAGAHIFCEKPFMRTPAECDEVLALAERKKLKIAVAHQMRMAHAVVHLKKKMDEGALGELVEMRAFGKQDKRAGGEDLMVLGIHLFDLMRMFGGEPQWCWANVREKGKDATRGDARPAGEDIGPVVGDEIEARFAFEKTVSGSFTSRGRLRDYSGNWGIELIGTKGVARILADIWPRVLVRELGKWEDAARSDAWKPLEGDGSAGAPAAQRSTHLANKRLVDDLLAAIGADREPTCSGRNAAVAIEMAMGVWWSGLDGVRVGFPLEKRGHPLLKG